MPIVTQQYSSTYEYYFMDFPQFLRRNLGHEKNKYRGAYSEKYGKVY